VSTLSLTNLRPDTSEHSRLLNIYRSISLESIIRFIPFIHEFELLDESLAKCLIELPHPRKPYELLKMPTIIKKYISGASLIIELSNMADDYLDEDLSTIMEIGYVNIKIIMSVKDNAVCLQEKLNCKSKDLCDYLGNEFLRALSTITEYRLESSFIG